MVDWLVGLSPWQQALAGTIFTYGMTAFGAALVFFFKEINKNAKTYNSFYNDSTSQYNITNIHPQLYYN